MLKIDLHSHTNYLQKNETGYGPKELIDKVVELGFDAIAITEHYFVCNGSKYYKQDPLKTFRDFKGYAKKKGLLLIPGTELRFKEGEVVLFNFDGDVTKIKDINDLSKLPSTVLRIAPHPFFIKGFCLGKELIKNIHLFDAIEYSHFYLPWLNRNKKAVRMAKKYGKVLVGTSDAHRLYQLNHTYTLVDAEKDADKIVKAIKEGKYSLKTKPLSFLTFLRLAFMGTLYCFLEFNLVMLKQALSK